MNSETLFTTVIPIIMVVCIVAYNLWRIRKNINSMKGGCDGGCKTCAHSSECQKPEKKE